MDIKLNSYQQVLILFFYFSKSEPATTGFLPEGRQCACVGDRLIYNCSIVGGTATLWRGSVFDCPQTGSEITLRHSLFVSNGVFRICNNGDIVGRSIRAVNNSYTSQLNVTVRESFNNKTVQCVLSSNEGTRTVGESILYVISVSNLHPPPEDIYLADVQPGRLVFSWTASDCSTVIYDITSDCGICPVVTNTTTATCSSPQLSPNARLCHFRVSSVACNLSGSPSSPVAVILKVPNVPQIEIIPSYSSDSQILEKLFIIMTMNQTEDLFTISGNISGSPTSYTTHVSNVVSGSSFDSSVGLSSCEEGSGCPIELSSSNYCPKFTVINVTISAVNKLGEGPHSDPLTIECANNFIQVEYKETSSESIISCVFLNLSDTSNKTCCITHRLCDKKGLNNAQKCNKNSPYNINLEVSGHSGQTYCYTVTASNGTYTVKVEGTFILGDNLGGSIDAAAVATGVIVSIALSLFSTGIIVWVVWVVVSLRAKNKPWQPHNVDEGFTQLSDIHLHNPLKQYLTPYNLPDTFKLHEVDGDCELREYIAETLAHIDEFKRGHTYYEFTNKIENILEGKEVLLQDKMKTEKWFRLDQPKVLAAGRLELYGEGIDRNSFGEQYRVFIQSFGSGARHLPSGTNILCNHSSDRVQPDVLPLVPVCSEHFAHNVIEEECTIQQFCTQNRLNSKAFNIFLHVEHLPERMRCQQPRDVILMNRESRKLFTGPFARQMFDPRNGGEPQTENEKWKVFALLEKNKQGLILKKGSEVLYQDSMYQTGNYSVLEVEQDCVRMSKFIETKLNCKFEDGKAFYEMTENEEDLLYYKKSLRPKKDELGCEELKLESLIEYFYAIPGVPSKAFKPTQLIAGLEHCKVFIQSTSQGSRCLKAGTKILYLKEYIKLNSINAQTGDHPEVLQDLHEQNPQLTSAL